AVRGLVKLQVYARLGIFDKQLLNVRRPFVIINDFLKQSASPLLSCAKLSLCLGPSDGILLVNLSLNNQRGVYRPENMRRDFTSSDIIRNRRPCRVGDFSAYIRILNIQ